MIVHPMASEVSMGFTNIAKRKEATNNRKQLTWNVISWNQTAPQQFQLFSLLFARDLALLVHNQELQFYQVNLNNWEKQANKMHQWKYWWQNSTWTLKKGLDILYYYMYIPHKWIVLSAHTDWLTQRSLSKNYSPLSSRHTRFEISNHIFTKIK